MRRAAVALRVARPRRHGACSLTRVDPALFSLRELQSFTAELRLGDAEGRPGYERWVDAQWPPPWNEGFIGEGLMARLADGAMDATQPLELTARLTQHARAAGVHLLVEAFDADGSFICGAIAGSRPRRRTQASVRVVASANFKSSPVIALRSRARGSAPPPPNGGVHRPLAMGLRLEGDALRGAGVRCGL